MHWKNLANYDYLGAYSLDGVTEEVTLTIKDIKRQMVTGPGGQSEMCTIAHFEEKEANGVVVKPMVLNVTNCKMLEFLYNTPHIEKWVGKRFTVHAAETKMGREIVPCLRVKNEKVDTCSICGEVIAKKIYDYSLPKYGRAICSKECAEKIKDENKGEE